MDQHESAPFDDFIEMVRKDPSCIESILAANEDVRAELEPVLRTAIWLEGVDHPEMMPDEKRQHRRSTVTNNHQVPENLWIERPSPPHPDIPGDQFPQ